MRACRLRIRVREVVEHLFDAHRGGRRNGARGQKAAHVRVRRAIDVDRERRRRLLFRVDEVVIGESRVLRFVGRLRLGGRPNRERRQDRCHPRTPPKHREPRPISSAFASFGTSEACDSDHGNRVERCAQCRCEARPASRRGRRARVWGACPRARSRRRNDRAAHSSNRSACPSRR